MFLLVAIVLFAIFTINVALGAFSGSAFVGDVGEMLILFGASIAFTGAILRAERAKKSNDEHHET
jgi:hypothetical protein